MTCSTPTPVKIHPTAHGQTCDIEEEEAKVAEETTASSEKVKAEKAVKEEEAKLLGPEQATEYRGLAARMNHLAMDRADVRFATKEICC